jgi:hypothetical protein
MENENSISPKRTAWNKGEVDRSEAATRRCAAESSDEFAPSKANPHLPLPCEARAREPYRGRIARPKPVGAARYAAALQEEGRRPRLSHFKRTRRQCSSARSRLPSGEPDSGTIPSPFCGWFSAACWPINWAGNHLGVPAASDTNC